MISTRPDHGSITALVTFTRPLATTSTQETVQREKRRVTVYSMSEPSIAIAEAFKQFSQVTVSAVGGSEISIPSFRSLFTLGFVFTAARLRTWDSRETHSSRGRSARPAT